jgi:hypothetical protein
VASFLVRFDAGPWIPGLHLLPALPALAGLCGWGLRRAPRPGVALALLTAGITGWLVVAVATGATGLTPPDLPAWLGIAAVSASLATVAGVAATRLR